jgi:PAS domain S-box-containing protein
MYTPDGEAVYWSVTGAPLRAEDGGIIGAVAIHRDITAQKRLERDLRQSRDELQAILDAVPDQVIVYDTTLHLVRSNATHRAAIARFHPTGDAPDELSQRIQRTRTVFRDLNGAELSEGDWPQQRILRGETLSGPDAVETKAYTITGEAQWWTISGAPLRAEDGTVIGAVLVNTDITRRRELEDALRESETRFRELADHAPLFVWISDGQARVTYANQSLLDYFGAPAQSLVEAGSLPAEVWQSVVHPEDVAALSDHHQRGLRERAGWEMEVRFWEAATNGYQWHLVKVVPRLVSGQFLGFIGVGINIDDRKRAENALRAGERQLRAALEVSPVGLAFVDAEGKATMVNQAVRTIWGEAIHLAQNSAAYGEYKAWWPESGKRLESHEWGLARALSTGTAQPADEIEIEALDGTHKTILNANAPILDDDGVIAGGVSVIMDITERRRLEREATKWAAQLDATFKSLTDGAFLYDSSGQLLRMNDAARVVFALDTAPDYSALSPEERIARLQVRDAHDRPLAPEEWGLRNIALGERLMEPVELRITALDGQTKDLAITGGPVRASDGTMIGAVSLLRDVTQRRQMERAVAEQSAQLQATFDALADPICVFDATGRILRQNRAELDTFGFDTPPLTIEERAARIDLRDEEGRRMPPERLPARRVLTGETLVGIDTILLVARGADGGGRWYMVGGAPLRNEAGQISGGVIIFRDVTERRLLGQQTRWQASMLERAHDAIFMWELDGPILYWNHGAEQLYGYSSAEALGQISHRLLHTERPVSPAIFKKTLKREGEWIGDILHTTRDGRRIVVDSRHQLLTEPDGRRYVLEVCRDITDRLELERELRRSRDELEQRVVERTHDLAQANTELRRLSHRILEVQEAERRLIARELHDEIGQALTGVKMMLELLETHADQASVSTTIPTWLTAGRLPQLSEVRASVGETLARVRDLSLDLRPAILDSMGLLPALLWQFERYTHQTNIEIHFHQTGLDHRLSLEVETAAYRIIQEALTNVARHADVSQAVVQVRVSDETLTVFVVDEGAGFDAEQAEETTVTMGQAGMRERAHLLGGILRISSAPGEGTTIEAELPLMASFEPPEKREWRV